MSEVTYCIEPSDIEWEMDWSQRREDGSRVHPDKPEKELRFEKAAALAHLLINEVVFLNSHWWEEEWPEAARKLTSISVNCNDVFAWGCADAETMNYEDIEPLYRMWAKDPDWGAQVWCIIRRKEMPQRPVEKAIRAGGVWDLDALRQEHGLLANYYDGVSMALARRKRTAYCEWAKALGNEPLPFDAGWWRGWNEYTAAHPDWHSPEWKAEDDQAIAEWRAANGWAKSENS